MNKTIIKAKLKRAWATAVLNFKNLKIAYIIPAGILGALIVNMIIFFAIPSGGDNSGIENNVFYGVALLAAILIPSRNFKKNITLNIKKKDFFFGAAMNYAILSFAVSLVTLLLFYFAAQPVTNAGMGYDMTFLALYRAFGWSAHNPAVGFLQQFGFLFFWCVLIHTLVGLQDKWIGWVIDCVIVAAIPIFSVLQATGTLRIWSFIFYPIIFGHPAAQILFTVIGGAALYCLNLLILKKKNI